MLRGCPKSDIFVNMESCFWQKWRGEDHEGWYIILIDTLLIIFIHLREVLKHASTNGCLFFQHSILSLCWEVSQNRVFYMEFDSSSCQKWHGIDNKEHIDAIRSTSSHLYTSKEGYETLKQQWMYLIIAQHPISCAERVPKTLHFVWNLRVVLGRNDTRLIIRGSEMISKAPVINIVYLKEGYAALKHQWMSRFTAHHPISCAERVPNQIWYFAWNLRVVFGRNDTV